VTILVNLRLATLDITISSETGLPPGFIEAACRYLPQ
jgi:hypothetical protein